MRIYNLRCLITVHIDFLLLYPEVLVCLRPYFTGRCAINTFVAPASRPLGKCHSEQYLLSTYVFMWCSVAYYLRFLGFFFVVLAPLYSCAAGLLSLVVSFLEVRLPRSPGDILVTPGQDRHAQNCDRTLSGRPWLPDQPDSAAWYCDPSASGTLAN